MRPISILALALVALLLACNRQSDGEMRVTKTELKADRDPQIDPQVCWITATGRQGHSRVEYRAVNWNGSCPEIDAIVVNHDGMLIRKGDSAFSSGDPSFWSAAIQSERVIQ